MRIRLRDIDDHGKILAIIETQTTTVENIRDIVAYVKATVDGYSTEDLKEALPDDCIWREYDFDSEEVWF